MYSVGNLVDVDDRQLMNNLSNSWMNTSVSCTINDELLHWSWHSISGLLLLMKQQQRLNLGRNLVCNVFHAAVMLMQFTFTQ